MIGGYWFKPKKFGYGATPTTWQGWAVIGLYVAVVPASVLTLLGGEQSRTPVAWLTFSVVAIATALMVWISWRRTDGPWRWRWGARFEETVGPGGRN
jgi:hypothetical protein